MAKDPPRQPHSLTSFLSRLGGGARLVCFL